MSCQKDEEKQVSDSKEKEIGTLGRRRSSAATKLTLHSIPMRVIKEDNILETQDKFMS